MRRALLKAWRFWACNCDRCGGVHETHLCPLFMQPCEDHPDAELRAGQPGSMPKEAPCAQAPSWSPPGCNTDTSGPGKAGGPGSGRNCVGVHSRQESRRATWPHGRSNIRTCSKERGKPHEGSVFLGFGQAEPGNATGPDNGSTGRSDQKSCRTTPPQPRSMGGCGGRPEHGGTSSDSRRYPNAASDSPPRPCHPGAGALEVLDLRPRFSDQELRAAYKRAVLQWHPDRPVWHGCSAEEVRQATDMFRRVKDAYDLLSKKPSFIN